MIKRMAAFFSRHEKNECGNGIQRGAEVRWAQRERIARGGDEEDGIGIMKALAILSAHEHRETSLWRLVEEQHFKNGRLDETHLFVESAYEKPHDYFEPAKMLLFEAEAIAKSYVMASIESQVKDIQGENDDDDDDD
jgi:hypothetical protein